MVSMEYRAPYTISSLDALKELYPDSSKRTLLNWLKNGRFTLDGEVLKREKEIQKGQVLKAKRYFKPPKIKEFPILFEDRYLIVIDKPSSLLSVPLDDRPAPSALQILRQEQQQAYPVHRLDREASGTLLFAKTEAMQEKLKALFETRSIKREYFAIVEGRLGAKQGQWDLPLLELPNFHVIASQEGKRAITHFEVLSYSTKYSYLKISLETGRKHQIRVHASEAGHPILGDLRYRARENPMRRLMLHAFSLTFLHPFTGKPLCFHSPLPPSFKGLGAEKHFGNCQF